MVYIAENVGFEKVASFGVQVYLFSGFQILTEIETGKSKQ